ncbi:carboxylesterase/lipase family protein [Pseudoduganella namucuonensis]|uniref:Carboxylic ester hydrolase n=1 Tax=Pseudoduganella namucuonensis TaxID=1035707 RepID=A0A1I7L7W2_9BURK|nr:carboxylesterase family protein [Pseudoduganella namucuonensis]SFV05574.1 para-nitrobenzyl esterase [Pseudoduganella namucuonensis]
MYILLIALLAAAALFAWKASRSVPPPQPKAADKDSLRLTAEGPVLGFADRHDTHAWLGIPYAKPPVGELRWKAPRPAQPWSEPRPALEYGAVAMQFAGETIGAPEPEWGRVAGSEDCLTLNVYAPRMTAAEAAAAPPLPVMVWIHGGANTAGTAAAYGTLRNLAGRDRVIVVSMNYRLGIFGWFSLAELAQDGDSPEDRSGNFGTLDIIAALRWVRRNIAAFGGDPGNVTVFGESAGGLNVYTLLASPLAAGLFQRAIAQSPITVSHSPAQARNFANAAEPGHELSSRELLRRWLVPPPPHDPAAGPASGRLSASATEAAIAALAPGQLAATLRAMPAAQLLAAVTPAGLGFYDTPHIVRDGAVLPHTPMQELFKDASAYNAVPVIIGSNRDEYKLFMAGNPEFVRLYLGKLPVIRDPARYRLHAHYLSDLWKASCVDGPASSMVEGGNPHVWVYRFDWDEHATVPLLRLPLLLGAAHVMEVPFVLRDLDGEFDPVRCATKANRPGRQQVSDAMAGCWTAFARDGLPRHGGPDTPAWPRWTSAPGADKLMLFDSDAGGGVRTDTLRLDVEQLKRELAAEPALRDQPRERVRLFARMFNWSVFSGQASAAEFARFAEAQQQSCSPEEFRPAHWP